MREIFATYVLLPHNIEITDYCDITSLVYNNNNNHHICISTARLDLQLAVTLYVGR